MPILEGARTIEVRRVKTYAGFCGGVKRAWNRAVKASKSTDEPILLSGKLIHNTPAMRELASMGVRVATDEDLAQETVGRKIGRAHV